MSSSRHEKASVLNKLLDSYIEDLNKYNAQVSALYQEEIELERQKNDSKGSSLNANFARLFSAKERLDSDRKTLEEKKKAIIELDVKLYGKSPPENSPSFLKVRK